MQVDLARLRAPIALNVLGWGQSVVSGVEEVVRTDSTYRFFECVSWAFGYHRLGLGVVLKRHPLQSIVGFSSSKVLFGYVDPCSQARVGEWRSERRFSPFVV